MELYEPIMTFDGKYAFLSNFFNHPITYDGRVWKTSEHAYQAMKTLDIVQQEAIGKADTPGLAKRFGKKVTMREDWNDVRLGIMNDILEAKFSDPTLKEMLLSTGNLRLIEGNTWGDVYWGVDLRKRTGQNMLGKLLMQIRLEAELEMCTGNAAQRIADAIDREVLQDLMASKNT